MIKPLTALLLLTSTSIASAQTSGGIAQSGHFQHFQARRIEAPQSFAVCVLSTHRRSCINRRISIRQRPAR